MSFNHGTTSASQMSYIRRSFSHGIIWLHNIAHLKCSGCSLFSSGVFRMCKMGSPGDWETDVPQWGSGQSPGRESGTKSPEIEAFLVMNAQISMFWEREKRSKTAKIPSLKIRVGGKGKGQAQCPINTPLLFRPIRRTE